MKFHITLNDDDYIAFNVCNHLSNPINKPNFLKGFLKSAAWSVLFVLLFFLFFDQDKFLALIVLAALLIFYGALVMYQAASWPRQSRKEIESYIKKMKEQGKLPYEPDMTVEFLEEEVRATGAFGVMYKKYSDFIGVLRDEEHIYITLGALHAVNLPLRCLDGKENELLEFLEGKLRQHGVQTDARS